MRIYNITNTSFLANKPHTVYTTNSIVQNTAKDIKDVFYDDINSFLNKKYNKTLYLQRFTEYINSLDNFDNFSPAEQDYIYDVFYTLDCFENTDKIQDAHLENLMKNLLVNKNT